jgi:malonyl-CoA decarboxylase
MPDDIQAILDRSRTPLDLARARCAVFYSISNCQRGLQGISFGHFLIKQVASDLLRDLPGLDRFVTLSPAPGLMAWLRAAAASAEGGPTPRITPDDVDRLTRPGWWEDETAAEQLRATVLPHVVRYFLDAKRVDGRPVDPVASFHLGNGARLERINWLADRSPNGLGQSGGVMVNYLYVLDEVEENHEAFADRGVIAAGKPIRQLERSVRAASEEEGGRQDMLARLAGRRRRQGSPAQGADSTPTV